VQQEEKLMKQTLKNLLLTALTLSLMSGSAMAHDQQYDNTKEPYESPHKAEPPTGGHANLAGAITNPIANLISMRIQDQYTPDNRNVDGSSNALVLQVVMPIKLSWESVPLLVTRTTIPYINTPDFEGGIGTQEGFGDTAALGFLVPKLDTKGLEVGFGYSLTIPTAGDNDYTGSGKWSAGPAALFLNLQTPTWQWGALVFGNFSFASQSSDRTYVSQVNLQPILTKHFDEGWYVSLPDLPQTYDYNTNEWTYALGGRVGKVTKFGQQPVELFGQITYNIRLAFEVGGNRFKSTLRCLDDAHGVFGAHKLGCSSLEIGICTSQRR
jgi:hypothetical protein